MNLAADIGNTLIKIGLFDGDVLDKNFSFSHLSSKDIAALLNKFPAINNAIISGVSGQRHNHQKSFGKIQRVIFLNAQTKLPFINRYRTPATLGTDRLAIVAGAMKYFRGKNVLAISAGTCITYDFISDKNIYSGGSISPGLRMRLQALHHFTARLPLVNLKPAKKITGASTADSILSGVINGITFEMDGFINEYKMKFPDIKIILTGGDANFFARHFKSSIFAAPHLSLTGLNEILNHNDL